MSATRSDSDAAVSERVDGNPAESDQADEHFPAELSEDFDDVVHECDLCGLPLGGTELLIHIHFFHEVEFSDVCPCVDCNLYRLNKFPAVEEADNGERLATDPAPSLTQNALVTAAGKLTGSQNGQNASQLTPVQRFIDEQITNRREAVGNTPSNPSYTQQTVGISQINHSRRAMPGPYPYPPSTATLSLPATPDPTQKLSETPQFMKTSVDGTIFFPGDGPVRERNLPYEMSLIESGSLHKDAFGNIKWFDKTDPPPKWLDDSGEPVPNRYTKQPMRWLPCLPIGIPRNTPGWQLICYVRGAETLGIHITTQDIHDRVAGRMGQSTLTSRMSQWQMGVNMLPPRQATQYNRPSKRAMTTVKELGNLQLKFNTW